MIIVHHLNNSRSQRVLWLLEELEVPYEIRFYRRDSKTMLAPAELRAVHPLGKSPVITDGTTTVAESGAILEYLVHRHSDGRLAPAPDADAWLPYTYWMHFAEGSAMPPLVMTLIFSRIEDGPMPFFARPVARAIARRVKSGYLQPQIDSQLAYIETTLARAPWFAGDRFSAADIQMSYPLEAAQARAGLDTRHPATLDFLGRIRARPAYQRAVERGAAATT